MLHGAIRLSVLCSIVVCYVGAAQQAGRDRYFKEDHLTGADYIRLSADGTYTLTGREHMGIWVVESGRWKQSGETIAFVPEDGRNQAYDGAQVTYGKHTFLAFSIEAAPGIVIPVKEIKQRLDFEPNALPPYVFFEITETMYERETQETYPFRTRRQ